MSIPVHKLWVGRASRRQQKSAHEFEIQGRTWHAIGAIVCLVGGAIAPILGAVLTGITVITGFEEGYGLLLHRFGTFLLFLTMPLLVVGAHLMDLRESSSQRN